MNVFLTPLNEIIAFSQIGQYCYINVYGCLKFVSLPENLVQKMFQKKTIFYNS